VNGRRQITSVEYRIEKKEDRRTVYQGNRERSIRLSGNQEIRGCSMLKTR
jgi:hypothetical protein